VACVAACAVLVGCADNKGASARPGSSDSVVTSTNSIARPVAAVSPGAAKTVLFLGTSLTAGLGLDPDSAYPQQIQRKIDSAGLGFQAVNAGVSGETSAGLLRRLDWVLQNPAAVIVVETGANDGLRGQPVEGTRATIGQVLSRIAKERPEAKVVLVQMEAPPNMGAEYTRAFHAMFPALAAEHRVALLPFLLDGVAGHAELNQGDGVHPNDVGEKTVAANVWRGLEPILKDQKPSGEQ
jgi:Lysophospholipase L1 and related esterases